MTRNGELTDGQLIEQLLDQPALLPAQVRLEVERQIGADPIVRYAYCDLGEARGFTRQWLIATPHQLLWKKDEGRELETIERTALGAIEQDSGPGGHVLRVHRAGAVTQPPWVLRFTRRQHHAVDSVVAYLKEGAAGPAPRDADLVYQAQTARPIRQAQSLVSSHRLSVLWRLLSYLRPYSLRLLTGLGATASITLLSLVPPYLSGYLIDHAVGEAQAHTLQGSEALQIAWLAVAGMMVAHILRHGCHFLRLRMMTALGEFVARDLRDELYRHLHSLSLSFFSRRKTGSLITRVSADTDRLWEFLALGVVDVSLAVVMLLGLSAILLHLDPYLALIVILPLPLIFLAIRWHGRRMEQLFLVSFRRWSVLTDILSDTIPGMRVVQAFDQGSNETRRFSDNNRDCAEAFNRAHSAWTSFWPLITFVVQFSSAYVWVVALPRLSGEEGTWGPPLSAGTFVSFLLYTSMFAGPVETLGQISRVMNRATTSAHRVFEVLDSQPEIVPKAKARSDTLRGLIEFDDVTFSHDGVRPTLRGLSFVIQPGELVGLVGPSGGGKSTIIQLLSRFHDVGSGRVLLDGVDIREFNPGAVRRQMGLVQQDPYLFHGTIVDNIRYGLSYATLPEVIEAARIANAHDFICRLPQGYDTVVGERGHTLSGGERQRVSIARAVLLDPRILILDEATSAVDTETEYKIQQALGRLIRGRTVIAIAHRLSTVRDADRLFVIEGGQIAESGSHAELIQRKHGTYRRLHELQHALGEHSWNTSSSA